MNRKKKTVGAQALDLMQKEPESRDPIELQREMQAEYVDELLDCAETYAKKCIGDFYIVVITKNEKLLPNVFRNFFLPRISCPTPDYDQSVYKYHHEHQMIEFIWTIPSKEACIHLRDNALIVDKSEHGLLQFVLWFEDGTLYRLAKRLNKEEMHSPMLVDVA